MSTVDLTITERVIVNELLRDGASNQEIASRLNRSTETVKSHLQRITTKAGVDNRTRLVVKILRGEITVPGVSVQ